MRYKIVAVILAFLLLNVQCKKEKRAAIDVSKITETDPVGNLIGSIDNTDWTKDGTWTNDEINLFEAPTSVQLAGTETSTISLMEVFPNPLNSIFVLNINSSKATLLEIVVTDKFLTVQYRLPYVAIHAGVNLMQIKLDVAKFENNTNYRIYYGFYSLADGQYYRGHGDIRISR